MRPIWVPQVLCGLLLLWALNPSNPYAYYTLLRWVTCAAFAYLASQAAKRDKEAWVWILGVTAAIYNPIVPVHLPREVWSGINVITIGIAATSIVTLRSVSQGVRPEPMP